MLVHIERERVLVAVLTAAAVRAQARLDLRTLHPVVAQMGAGKFNLVQVKPSLVFGCSRRAQLRAAACQSRILLRPAIQPFAV